jgi:hypothetical protein
MISKIAGGSTRRGRISSPFLQQEKAAGDNYPTFGTPSRYGNWNPSQEIPEGTVKGRVSSLFSRSSETERSKDNNQDPWIISSQTSTRAFTKAWGEAAATLSSDSEEWRNSNKDWLGVTESLTSLESLDDKKTKEEKNLVEIDSITRDRDADVLEMAARKKKFRGNRFSTFENVNDRDLDILTAAKLKSSIETRPNSPRETPLFAPHPKDSSRSWKETSEEAHIDDFIIKQSDFLGSDPFNSNFSHSQVATDEKHSVIKNSSTISCLDQTVSVVLQLENKASDYDQFFDTSSTHLDVSLRTEEAISMDYESTPKTPSHQTIEEDERPEENFVCPLEKCPQKQKNSFFKFFSGKKSKNRGKKIKNTKISRFPFGSSNRSKEFAKIPPAERNMISPPHWTEKTQEMSPTVTTQTERMNKYDGMSNPAKSNDAVDPDNLMTSIAFSQNNEGPTLAFSVEDFPSQWDQTDDHNSSSTNGYPFVADDDIKETTPEDNIFLYSPKKKIETVQEELLVFEKKNLIDLVEEEENVPSQAIRKVLEGERPQLTHPIDDVPVVENIGSWHEMIGTPPPPPPPREEHSELQNKTDLACLDSDLDHIEMEGNVDDADSNNNNMSSERPKETSMHSLMMAKKKRKTQKLRKYEEITLRQKQVPSIPTVTDRPRNLKNSPKDRAEKHRETNNPSALRKSSRHAKIRQDPSLNYKIAKRQDSSDAKGSNHHLKITSKGKRRSKARTYARQRAGYTSPSQNIELQQSTSSEDSRTLASIGSDLRVLRAVLKKSRKNSESHIVLRVKDEFPSYDTSDPMQEAGIKLLSVAIIPIQTEVRRFLAMRHALTRMWAIVVIQAQTRRFLAHKRHEKAIHSAVIIQAMIRGHLARDDLDFKQVCAIEIQRMMRGYLATMTVYEDIYKVTIIQSLVRMKLAIQKVTQRSAHIIQLQSVARGFLARRRQEYRQLCALAIQANWRRFYTRLNYQFNLLDIIIAQSVWREKVAIRKAKHMRSERLIRSAIIIQTKWRQYDATMNYLHYLADILIAQSASRRYLAKKQVSQIRDKNALVIQTIVRGHIARKSLRAHFAARRIQSAWRGFVSYADYMFSIADIVTVQRIARAWLAKRAANEIYDGAATVIQKSWRCFIDKTKLSVMKAEHTAAIVIQCQWRRFWCFSNFIIALDCSIRIQAAFRGYRQRRKLEYFNSAANTIQSVYRQYSDKVEIYRLARIQDTAEHSRDIAEKEGTSAICIQTLWRQKKLRFAYQAFIAARRIQTFWRYRTLHNAYRYYRSAVTIQSNFRAMKAKQDILILRGEVLAATLIQSSWRGFVSYTDYIFTISDIITIQKLVRGFLARQKDGAFVVRKLNEAKKKRRAAIAIQKGSRGFISRQSYWYTLGCTMQIQSWMRGRIVVLRLRYEANIREKARLKLQCFARRCFARQEYLQRKFIFMLIQTAEQERSKKIAALVIQEKCHKYLDEKRRDEAARVIQRFFLMVRREVDQLVRAAKRRKHWRKQQTSKNRQVAAEDALLEHAWRNTVNGCNLENNSFLSQKFSVGGFTTSKESEGSRHLCCKIQDSQSRRHYDKKEGDIYRETKMKKKRLPPTYSDALSSISGVLEEDDKTDHSQITASPSTFYRFPSARKKMSSKDLNDDLKLEQAYMDAEICNAKDRRIAAKHISSFPVL